MSDAFDLPGFDAGKKGPKRTGKLPPGFKSRERSEKPDRPAGPRKPFAPGDGPRRKFEGDRPRGGAPFRGDRPARAFGDKPAWKKDGPGKPFGARKPFGDRGDRPFRKPEGGKPAWKKDRAPAAFVPELSPEVKKFLPLLTEKGRYKESRFLIEGAKNIADAAEYSPEVLHTVLVAEGFEDDALKARLNALRVRTRVVAEADLSALCGTETPQGIVAVANFGALRPDWSTIRSVTLLDGIQDPGNLGAILRTSAALGMDAVVLGKGTCDPYNPKVVRASAASLLRLPLETDEDLAAKIQFLRLKGFTVVATSPRATITLEQARLKRKVALLFGNEGGGVGANLVAQADETVRIPMRGKVESLNVAVAHGLLAYDLMKLQGF